MAVYKIARCPVCKYSRVAPSPQKTAPLCPKTERHPDESPRLVYSEKWYVRAAGVSQYAVSRKKSEAEAEERKLLTNQAEGKSHLNKIPSTTWTAASEKFLDWAGQNLTPKGAAMYRSCIGRLGNTFGGKNLNRITSDMIEVDYVAERRAEGVKDSTINREITTLKRLFSKCEEWRMASAHEIRRVKKLDEPDQCERFYSDDEISKILQECEVPIGNRSKVGGRPPGPHLKMIVVLALNTGMRKKNCLLLRRSDIDFPNRQIRITLVKKRKNRRLTIPMTKQLHDALLQYMKSMQVVDMNGWLFPTPKRKTGDPIKPMRADADFGFDSALKRARIKQLECPECKDLMGPHDPEKPLPECPTCRVTARWRREECFHTLRHTFASHWLQQMVEAGRDVEGCLKILQEILGHTDIKTTMRYLHVVEDTKKRAMDQFSIGGSGEE